MLYAHTLAGHPKKTGRPCRSIWTTSAGWQRTLPPCSEPPGQGRRWVPTTMPEKATEGFQRRLEGGPRVDHSTAGAVLLGQRWEASPSRQTAAPGHHAVPFSGLSHPRTSRRPARRRIRIRYRSRPPPCSRQYPKLPSWDPAAIPLPASPWTSTRSFSRSSASRGATLIPSASALPCACCFPALWMPTILIRNVSAPPTSTGSGQRSPPCRRWPPVWKTICIAKVSCTKAVLVRKNLKQARPRLRQQ